MFRKLAATVAVAGTIALALPFYAAASPVPQRSSRAETHIDLTAKRTVFTLAQVPLTVSVLLEPPTLSDFPSAQSMSAVVPNDP